MRYEQYKAMQDIREIEFRDSRSNANTKICSEVRAVGPEMMPSVDLKYNINTHTRILMLKKYTYLR